MRDFFQFLFQLAPEHSGIDAELLQQTRRKPLALPHQGHRQMLDINLLMPGLLGQLLGFGKGFLRFDGQFVKADHGSPFSAFARRV